MKKIFTPLAIALALAAAPAFAADEFHGPRIGVTAAFGDTQRDVQYGVNVGADAVVTGRLVAGVEASLENFAQDAIEGKKEYILSGGVRVGLVAADTLFYGRVGYADHGGLDDGFQFGGGLERNLSKHLYTKLEYRYTDVAKGYHIGLVGFGYRF